MLIIDDDEAYSQGLVNVMIPILKKAGIAVDHQTLNGTDTGATLAAAIKSLVTSHLSAQDGVAMLPWQTATNAQMFGQDAKQAGKTVILFGTDGTNSPSQFNIPGTLRVDVRARHLAAARARSTRRSSPASPSTVRTGRSASRRTRPPTS